MSILFVGTEPAQNSGTTSLSCNVPSGTSDDDFLLAFCYHDATQNTTGAWDLPSGWSVLEAQNHQTAGRDRDTAIFYRIASSEPSSYTFTHNDSNEQSSVTINAWSGVDTSSPFDVTYSRGSHSLSKTNDPTPSQASITTATDNALILVLSAQTHDDITTVGFPTSFTGRSEIWGSVRDHRQQFVGEFLKTSAGFYQPGDWTHSSNSNAGEYTTYTLALREGATGVNYTLTADAGSYSQVGVAVQFGNTYNLGAAKGSFTQIGNSSVLTYTPLARILEGDTGSYSQTGVTVAFVRSYKLTGDTGSYSLTGNEAVFRRALIFHVDTEAYSTTGTPVALSHHYTLSTGTGISSGTGPVVGLLHHRVLSTTPGSVVQAGHPATLVWSQSAEPTIQNTQLKTHFKLSLGI